MKSWDCWDTLIARRSIRDVGNEANNVFPIAENVAKVQPGDILISDYYDERLLKRLIPEVTGLHNRIIVTEDGKNAGRIWPLLPGVTEHTGDNQHCDVDSPRKHGIKGTLSRLSPFTAAEEEFSDAGLTGLAHTIREARLVHWNASLRSLQLLQTQVNFPLLFIASLLLHCQIDTPRILMSSRDCCLWHHAQQLVRNLHHADYDVVYFHTSRIARAFPTPAYLHYVNSLLPGTIVDIGGTGWSLTRLLERTKHPDTKVVLLTQYQCEDLRKQYEQMGATQASGNILSLSPNPPRADLERANLANHAMFLEDQTTFNPLNINWEQVPEIAAMHEAFLTAVRVASNHDFSSDLQATDATLQTLLRNCFARVNYKDALRFADAFAVQEDRAVMARLKELSCTK